MSALQSVRKSYNSTALEPQDMIAGEASQNPWDFPLGDFVLGDLATLDTCEVRLVAAVITSQHVLVEL